MADPAPVEGERCGTLSWSGSVQWVCVARPHGATGRDYQPGDGRPQVPGDRHRFRRASPPPDEQPALL